MQTYKARILDKYDCAHNSPLVVLEKPRDFVYAPGQYIFIGFPNNLSIPARAYSLASAPHEPHLIVAMRDSESPFKYAIKVAKIGENLEIKGPYGRLALHTSAQIPAVFLAGGIGITPFRSMIFDEQKKSFPHKILLLYANRNKESACFLEELVSIKHKNFRCVLILEEPSPDIIAEQGLISENIVKKHVQNIFESIYYIVGPPRMVDSIKALISSMGVDKNNWRIESFTGCA